MTSASEERAPIVDGYSEVSKEELLTTIQRDRATWEGLVARAGDRVEQPGTIDEWSVKDIIAHLLVYERWQLEILGEPVRTLPTPPENVDMVDVEQRNAWFHGLDQQRSLEEVRAEATEVHQQVLALTAARPEEDLRTIYHLDAQGRLTPGEDRPAWPLWRWFVSNTYDHYRQHIPSLREWLEREARDEHTAGAASSSTRAPDGR